MPKKIIITDTGYYSRIHTNEKVKKNYADYNSKNVLWVVHEKTLEELHKDTPDNSIAKEAYRISEKLRNDGFNIFAQHPNDCLLAFSRKDLIQRLRLHNPNLAPTDNLERSVISLAEEVEYQDLNTHESNFKNDIFSQCDSNKWVLV